MNFYDDPDKLDEYEKMCEEYDGSELYTFLEKHLANGSSILELGSGPGYDVKSLQQKYTITGSDLSDEFLRRCRNKYPDIPFLKLDAVAIDTEQPFDCIFSNKVLHHLTMEQLKKSLARQQQVLKANGLFAHTFWLGDKEFTMEGMLFVFHDLDKLKKVISQYFTIVDLYIYKEFEDGDSVFIIARNDMVNR